jgi:protein SFI1
LTFADVAILHDIVLHAQELLPSLPERERLPTNALFHAYYSILPSIGIDADHDSRYARVLFKIGGTRNDGSLYEKFEAVLARMGIAIQFDPDNNGEGEGGTTEAGFDQGSDPQLHLDSTPAVADNERSRCRAKSDIQALEPGHKHQGEENWRRRASSSASTAHSENVVNRLSTPPSLPHTTAQNFKQNLLHTQSHDGEQGDEKDYGLRAWLNDNLGKYPRRTRTRSSSTHGSMRVRRRSPPVPEDNLTATSTSYPALGDFITVGADQQRASDLERINQPKAFAPTSEDLMNTKVGRIKKLHIENLTRQILFRWHQKAMQLQEDNNNLEILAKRQDRRVLLRQAFDSWRDEIRERQQIAETERFFQHLERRAGRARDLFLMAKSLTHWAYSASKEIQRTSAARRHILRTRYFSAWRDTTAVNELKVRRQILRKFFSVWQKQHVTLSVNKEKSVLHFTDNLVQRIFWAWFWAFCERRTPVWRSDKLLGRQMVLWVRVTNERKKEDSAAIDYYYRNIGRKTCFAWSTKAHKHAAQIRQAHEYRTISLCRKAIRVWRHGSALLPRLQCLCQKVGLRLKRDSLKLWVLRARQESHARATDRSKIMREAWITWNDKLRCQALQLKISNRLVLQGLYKWVLGERLVLARRLIEHRMMHTSVQKLAEALQSLTAKDSKDVYLAEETFVHKLSSSVIRNWRNRLQNHLQHQRVALNFNSPVILSNSLARWSSQNQRVRQLHTWAHDGEFYFLASKTIRSWKDAIEKAKKEKRRLAYTQFRRRYKISLARRMFSRWQQETNSIAQSDQLAIEFYHNKSVVLCIEAFDSWRARIEEVAELDLLWERSLLEKHFNKLKLSLISRRGLEMEATTFFEDHAVTLCMKRWSRVYLQLRARQHLVFELHEKHLKKTSRRMLAHWLQRTSQRQRLTDTRDREMSNLRSLEGAESWIGSGDDPDVDEWADGVDDVMSSTPMPGYLSTPSRRMPRAKATIRLPSTTPSAPLSTPVERQLRAQYSGGPLPSFRRRIGRSLLGREGTSLDLGEESRISTKEEATE